MEEQNFLITVADDIRKALNAGGYKDIEFFDEELVMMDGPAGEDDEGNPTAARSFKPVGEQEIIISLAYLGKKRYELLVTLDKDIDSMEFDKATGTHLKRLAGTWGSRLEYKLQTLGREIISKEDLKKRIRGNKSSEENKMSSQLAEKTLMTGTTRSSYQRIGECKVIIRHSGKVNEEKFGSRSRNIDAIFIETKSGERFKMAENNLHGARAMARHLSNGGSPFDSVGSKVTVMMNEMAQLRKMALEARVIKKTQVLSEEQDELVNQIKARFVGLRETLKKMSGKVGYMRHSPMLEGEEALLELETDPTKQGGYSTGSDEDDLDMSAVTMVTNYLDKMGKFMAGTTGDRSELRREAFSIIPKHEQGYFTSELSKLKSKGELIKPGDEHSSGAKKFRIQDTQGYKAVYGGDTDDAPMNPALAHMSRSAYAGPTPGSMAINEAGKTTSKTETKAAKKKEEKDTVLADQVPVYDRPTDGRFPELTRDADSMHSVNENKYGVAPEETILESWFDEAATVEFFNEEELVIEDAAPEVKKTLPENALGMLNLYVGHPLFNHYMKMYETQEILDAVLALVEEGSKLCENITTVRETISAGPSYGVETMTIGRGGQPADTDAEVANFDEALSKINTLISDRRLNLENAIDQVAKGIIGEEQDSDSYSQMVDHLWGLAEESGLVKHDFGSTFSDQVLAPNETISAHNDEIDAEEFYGDARFAESDESDEEGEKLDEMEVESMWAKRYPGYWATLYDLNTRGYNGEDIMRHAHEEFDNEMSPDDIEVMVHDFLDMEGLDINDDHNDGQPTDYEEYQDFMGGDDWDQGQYDMDEELNQVRKNAGLPPMVRETEDKCSCGCDKGSCECGPECKCGCNAMNEGDPFGRQSKRNLANPKSRMSLINPEDKISSSTLGEEDEVDEGKAVADWVGNRQRSMDDRLDRSGYGNREEKGKDKVRPRDQYDDMADRAGISSKTGMRGKKPQYEEVEMPHHLPAADKPKGTPKLSEDGARIIELARYKQ